uniref:ChsH2 C-terminal OB-fold domain-containing protein n=1 Tax=Caulobacter sp. (strain K31) TaxID=366602 RepID=B0T3Q3_CAUSK
MTMATGIVSFGAYVPRLRLQRAAMAQATAWFNPALAGLGRGERAIANWDEDAVTMAVEAARDCLGDRDRSDLGRVILASTTLPFADRQNAGIVKEALALDDEVAALDVTGSQRSGASALIAALEMATAAPVLCMASDRRLARPGSAAEFHNGDAAAAMLVGRDAVIAEFLGAHSVTVDFVDHYRAAGQDHDYEWETRWIRDEGYAKLIPAAITGALHKLGLEASAVDVLITAVPAAGVDRLVAAAAGVRPEAVCEPLHDRLGFAGAAQPLVLLAQALATARPGMLILVAAFGQGVDVLAFRTTEQITRRKACLGVDGWLARRRPESNYVKHLSFTGEVALDGGMRAELDLKTPPTMLYRDRRTILSLMGGRCRVTGAVQYPKTDISVSPNARLVGTQDDYRLADLRARVVTFTADHLAFSPDPPGCYGMIDFDGGGRMMVDMVDLDEDGLKVGDPVRMMFRLKRDDVRGFKHYFWKAAPDYRPAN